MTTIRTIALPLCLGLAACGGADNNVPPAAPSTPSATPPAAAPAPAPADTSAAAAAPAASAAAPAAAPAASGPDWAVSGTWAEACSCTIPCPCLTDKVPTMGQCDETMIFHVDKGHYGSTSLDGLDVVIVGQSTHGKTFNQSIADKDMPIVNTYLPSGASDDVANAADKIFSRLAFSMTSGGKKHSVKKLGIKAKFAPESVDIEVPGVLTAHMKAQKDAKGKAKVFDAFGPGAYGTGVQGVTLGLDFHDDGVSWKIKDRHAAWTPFAWDSTKGLLPWEPGYQAPPAAK
jgi:hypothetical protein